MLTILRLVLFTSGVSSIALSTIFFQQAGRSLMTTWWRRFIAPAQQLPSFLENSTVQRVWGVLSGLSCMAIAWYLGTADGQALMQELLGGDG